MAKLRTCVRMGAAGSTHGNFQRAVERGNLPVALATAKELGALSLEDALALTELFGRIGDSRFEAAAVRWLARLAAERQPALEALRLATALLAALPDETHGAAAYELLRSLARRRL
jgi:hypothetical protein